MTAQTIHFVVSMKIEPSKFAEFETIARQMRDVTREEPGALAYDWFMDADRQRCRLLEAYVDDAAMMAHLRGEAVQTFVPRMLECSSITNFEVYGSPSEEGLAILARVGAEIFSPWLALRH